jgi:hypothetical protein
MKRTGKYTILKLLSASLACGLTCSAQSHIFVANRSALLNPS